jgi:GNAT superfamily N-acetyltransferase
MLQQTQLPPYFQRLSKYFPQQELKPLDQFTDLLSQSPYYHKIETNQHILLYAEFPDFLFVDFMIVDSRYRNRGIGSQVIDQLKTKGIPIVLEVEPPDPASPDTGLRRTFYRGHDFHIADNILYRRKDKQGNPFDMDIFYWSPSGPLQDDAVLAMMTQVCNSVHNYEAMRHYGRVPAEPSKVLSLRRSPVSNRG